MTQVAKLTASDGAPGDDFGVSVAIERRFDLFDGPPGQGRLEPADPRVVHRHRALARRDGAVEGSGAAT